MRKICNFLIKLAVYGLVFLIPIFWLPWTNETLEFNKQYLLFFLVGLALLAWLAKMIIVQKRLTFYRTPLDLWILIFMLLMVLSAVFSVDQISSWLGFYGRFSDSVVGLLAMAVLYFIVVNNLRVKSVVSSTGSTSRGAASLSSGGDRLIPEEGKNVFENREIGSVKSRREILSLDKILKLFLISVCLVVIVAYLSLFGFWSKIPSLPRLMSFSSFNPVSSSLQGLSIFLVAVISLLVGLLLQSARDRQKRKRVLAFYYSLFTLATLLLIWINFQAAWLALGAVMLILLVTALWSRLFREKVNLLILPVVLILVSVAGLTGFVGQAKSLSGLDSISESLPKEVILDYQTAAQVSWRGFREHPVLGSGPGTFLTDFAKFKPTQFNENRFWNIRFEKGPSQLMEMFNTTGLLGVLGYLAVISIFILIIFTFLRQTAKGGVVPAEQAVTILSFFFFWSALLLGQFVYLGNTVLFFYFWLTTALVAALWQATQGRCRRISFSFKKLPEVGLLANVLLLIIVFVLVGLFYLGGRFYVADLKFSQAVTEQEELVRNLEETVNLNGHRENYRRSLSQAYLISAWNEADKGETERNIQLLQSYASGAIQQARAATSISPNLVTSWQNLGAVYRDSRGLAGGTFPFALDAFKKTLELEPTNPFFYRELCRINLISEEKDWEETINYCQKAIDLKQDYLDAHIQLALVYEEKGDLEEARDRLKGALDKLRGVSFERGSELAGAATEIYFQLGRVQFNLGQLDQAISMFEQSVIVMPNYVNARYALALSYQSKGRLEDALTQLQLVDQLVPNNEDVRATIQQLEDQLQSAEPTGEETTEGE